VILFYCHFLLPIKLPQKNGQPLSSVLLNDQIIKHNGAPEYAIIPFDEWEKITSRMEDLV